MTLFVRAVVTGFGVSLGAALFKKVAKHLGLDEPDKKTIEREVAEREATQPITES
jgi:hypothetical protein